MGVKMKALGPRSSQHQLQIFHLGVDLRWVAVKSKWSCPQFYPIRTAVHSYSVSLSMYFEGLVPRLGLSAFVLVDPATCGIVRKTSLFCSLPESGVGTTSVDGLSGRSADSNRDLFGQLTASSATWDAVGLAMGNTMSR